VTAAAPDVPFKGGHGAPPTALPMSQEHALNLALPGDDGVAGPRFSTSLVPAFQDGLNLAD